MSESSDHDLLIRIDERVHDIQIIMDDISGHLKDMTIRIDTNCTDIATLRTRQNTQGKTIGGVIGGIIALAGGMITAFVKHIGLG